MLGGRLIVTPGCILIRLPVDWIFDTVGTLGSRLRVIPGYLPLKLNFIRSAASETTLSKHISGLSQAAAGYQLEYDPKDPRGSFADTVHRG